VTGCTNNPVTASSGVAMFPACQITGTAGAGTYTLQATRSLITGTGASSNVVINAGSASSLSFKTQPVGGVTEGQALGTEPVVNVLDANGNVAVGDSGSVTLAVDTYSAGSSGGSTAGSVTGCTNNPVTASSGVATFAACQITGTAGAGTYTLQATRSLITGTGASSNVVINAGSATKLVLTAASTTPVAGATDALTITAEDTNGNTATTTYTGSHSLTFGGASTIGTFIPIVTNSSGTATTFGSGTAINFVNGQATVQSGTNNGVMTLYKAQGPINITVTDGSISNGTGLSVTVSAASVALSFTVACPSTLAKKGAGSYATGVSRATTDTYGNPDPNKASAVTVTLTNDSGKGVWSPATLNIAANATTTSTPTTSTYTTGDGNYTEHLSATITSPAGYANVPSCTVSVS
jgi:hypothetical protein